MRLGVVIGFNHCIGLFDTYLIKENHIRSAGCIAKAVAKAKKSDSSKVVEVEVTNLDELNQVIATRVGIVMLGNFSSADIDIAVSVARSKVALEVSRDIDSKSIVVMGKTGVNFISVEAIIKHIKDYPGRAVITSLYKNLNNFKNINIYAEHNVIV